MKNKTYFRNVELNLKGKTALITGAAHGQGRSSALALAREGVHIGAIDIAKPISYPAYSMGSHEDLHSLRDECEKLGVKCFLFNKNIQ